MGAGRDSEISLRLAFLRKNAYYYFVVLLTRERKTKPAVEATFVFCPFIFVDRPERNEEENPFE